MSDDEGKKGKDKTEIAGTSAYPRIPIPSMTEAGIENYFASMEYWFLASGVTNDARKFHTIMAQVPPSKLPELRVILEKLPDDKQYDYIKNKLTEHFAESQQRRLQRLLSDLPLGDMRPSLLFHQMVRLAGSTVSEQVIRDLWATRLPAHAQAAVVASSGSIEEVLRIADAIVESMDLRTVRAIDQPANRAEIDSENSSTTHRSICALREEIAVLTRRFSQAWPQQQRRERPSRSGSREPNNNRYRSNTPARKVHDEDNECWYHEKYGSRARLCRSPCRFKRIHNGASASTLPL